MSEVKYNKENLYKRSVSIYTERNPNPQSMKFMLNSMIVPDGESYDFPDKEAAAASPLAVSLFEFPYVQRVFFMNNFVTVTKAEEADWATIIPELKETIKTYFEEGNPALEAKAEADGGNQIEEEDSEAVKKIKGILDEYIKPAVEMDGGAIQFHSFNEQDGKLKVLLQGSCSGCPSSTVTLKSGIENMMKRMVPQVQEVIAEGV